MMQPDQLDKDIRRMSERGASTRQVVRELARQGVHVAQSTVWRRKQKMNTGPNPILPAGYRPSRRIPAVPVMAAMAVALILLAAAAVALLTVRISHESRGQQVTACVRYDAKTGDVTGITAGSGCPPGWESVTLYPGG